MPESDFTDSELVKKNMKQSHRNQVDVSPKTGRKGRKLKKNHSVDTCKCFTPLVKLHLWDCPEVYKPCPIHGNILYQNVKPEKVETDQNVTVSFHPSSRTEKLFEPVKSILAQCDPETKINFQYFSPNNFTDKENLKHETIQTNFEDLRNDPSSNFVEKKKSSVNEKTNKMKKLKECFHSPCDLTAHKYPPPVIGNYNENPQEEATQPWQNFFNVDINNDQNSEWFSSNPFGFKKLEKLTADKRDSDYITVTQQDKDVINHKIFEIDHKKGVNENQLTGFGKQPTQFAYSSFNINYPHDSRRNYKYDHHEKNKKPQLRREVICSRNSQTSDTSAGSVYVTPFFFVPPGLELSDSDSFEACFENGKRSVGVQVKEGECECEEKPRLITKYVQISAYESSDSASEQRMNTVSLQTSPPVRRNYQIYQGPPVSSEETISEKFSYNEKVVQTNIRDNTRVDTSKMKGGGGSKYRTTEVQTSNRYQVKEVLITRYNKPTREAGNQVQSGFDLQEGGSTMMNKSLMIHPSFANKKTQISDPSSERNIDVSTYKQLEYEENELQLQKYDSDSDYFERRKEERQGYTVIQKASSRSPERFQSNARRLNEERTSPVSDLSELKRIISEFFERATCNCREKEYELSKKNRVNIETMTEDPRSIEKTPRRGTVVSREIQTSEPEPSSKDKAVETGPTQMDGGSKQYRQYVLLDDVSQIKTNYICSFCGRNINKYSMNASTNTDDMFAVKEKTTIIETDYTEVTKVKKTTDPTDPTKKSITTSTKQTVRPITYYKTDNQKSIKTVNTQTSFTRSNIPVLISPTPPPPKNERQPRPYAYREPQEEPRRCSLSNCRARANQQPERRVAPPPLKDCQCSDMADGFLSGQEAKYTPRSGMNRNQHGSNRPDDDNRYREDSREKKESQKQPNRHFYHVTVNPPWPRELTNPWKPQEPTEDSLKRNATLKTGYEKDGKDTFKDTFSVKNFTEGEELRQGNYETEKQNYTEVEKSKKTDASKKENFGFSRMPSSSASQISMNKNSHYQSKMIKSEESVKTLNQQLCYTPVSVLEEDINDIYTVKSCHLHPIKKIAYNGRSSDRLMTCNNCKSLIYLKGNKNDDVSYVPGSNDQTQNQNTQSESEEKLPIEDVPDRQMYSLICENVEEQEEEYVEKCSNLSDTTSRTLENDSFKEENTDSEGK